MADVRPLFSGRRIGNPDAMESLGAARSVAPGHVSAYGIFDCDEDCGGITLAAKGLVEKPDFGTPPSTLAVVGRYIFERSIFGVSRDTEPGVGGEIQLTDVRAAQGGGHAFRFSRDKYDWGGMAIGTLVVQRASRCGHLRVAV
ncbi:MAG: hypothetical protein AAF366_01670 [Pseudomonadota bacterium]